MVHPGAVIRERSKGREHSAATVAAPTASAIHWAPELWGGCSESCGFDHVIVIAASAARPGSLDPGPPDLICEGIVHIKECRFRPGFIVSATSTRAAGVLDRSPHRTARHVLKPSTTQRRAVISAG